MSSISNFIDCNGVMINFTEIICAEYTMDLLSYYGDCIIVFKNGAIITVRMQRSGYNLLKKNLLNIHFILT